MILFVFKALNGLAPPYIAELLSPPWQYQDTKILQRFLKFQMANLQQKGDRAFFVAQGFGTASHPLLGSPPPWIFSDPDLRLTFSLNIWALLLILALWTCFICILCPEMSVLFLLFLLLFWLSYPAVQHFGDLTWLDLICLSHYCGAIILLRCTRICGTEILPTFHTALFGIIPPDCSDLLNQTLSSLLARRLIPLNWKSETAPSFSQWLKEVLSFLPLEKLRYKVRNASKNFILAWSPFIDFVGECPFQ